MKANEAPEKIYVHKSQYWGLMANEHNITKDSVEYIRTDAFVEKVCEWIKEKWDDNYTMPIIIDSVIDEFKNYIKEE